MLDLLHSGLWVTGRWTLSRRVPDRLYSRVRVCVRVYSPVGASSQAGGYNKGYNVDCIHASLSLCVWFNDIMNVFFIMLGFQVCIVGYYFVLLLLLCSILQHLIYYWETRKYIYVSYVCAALSLSPSVWACVFTRRLYVVCLCVRVFVFVILFICQIVCHTQSLSLSLRLCVYI